MLDALGFGQTLTLSKILSILTSIAIEISPAIGEFMVGITCDGSKKGYTVDGLQGILI